MDPITAAVALGVLASALCLGTGLVAWAADLPAVQDWLDDEEDAL